MTGRARRQQRKRARQQPEPTWREWRDVQNAIADRMFAAGWSWDLGRHMWAVTLTGAIERVDIRVHVAT